MARAVGMLPTGNWLLQSLTYMEDGLLADILIAAAKGQANAQQLKVAVTTPVPTPLLPDAAGPHAYPLINAALTAFGPLGARTDYAINGGTSTLLEAPAKRGRLTFSSSSMASGPLGRRTALKHIVDGSSNTYLVGEKSMDDSITRPAKTSATAPPSRGSTDNCGAANSYVRFAVARLRETFPTTAMSCHDFGSAHPTTWNVSMADGSVRSHGYDMDVVLHRMLASIDGQEAANKPE